MGPGVGASATHVSGDESDRMPGRVGRGTNEVMVRRVRARRSRSGVKGPKDSNAFVGSDVRRERSDGNRE